MRAEEISAINTAASIDTYEICPALLMMAVAHSSMLDRRLQDNFVIANHWNQAVSHLHTHILVCSMMFVCSVHDRVLFGGWCR